MPKETVQYPSTSSLSGSETSIHWNKAGDMPGYVQLHIQRHVWTTTLDPAKREHLTDCTCSTSDEICASLPKSCGCSDGMYCSNCPSPEKSWALGHGFKGSVADFDAQKVAAADAGTGPDNPYARERMAERATVISDPFTRDEINKLIRTLRRARDQAFGADE